MRITEDLINLLEDQYDAEDTFEPIIKGFGNNRKDSKRLEKADRKIEKESRKSRKQGKWIDYEMSFGGN